MKRIRTAIIILIVIVLLAGAVLLVLRPVNTEEQAINIAQFYVKTFFGNIFCDYRIRAELEGDVWIVSYGIEEEGYTQPGGGGPEIHLLKQIGLPIYFAFQA